MTIHWMAEDGPSVTNDIAAFWHCRLCLEELPPDESPMSYARTQTGWTSDRGVQAWCNRHDTNVVKLFPVEVHTFTLHCLAHPEDHQWSAEGFVDGEEFGFVNPDHETCPHCGGPPGSYIVCVSGLINQDERSET